MKSPWKSMRPMRSSHDDVVLAAPTTLERLTMVFTNAKDVLGHPWWAPLAAMLVVAELLVAQAFLIGDGTSNVLDAESTLAGATLALGGAGLLMAGLVIRSGRRAVGHALIIIGSALAAIWVWVVVMTPVALAVIVSVGLTQMRDASPAGGRS